MTYPEKHFILLPIKGSTPTAEHRQYVANRNRCLGRDIRRRRPCVGTTQGAVMSNSFTVSKIQNTVVAYKLKSPTYVDEITIVNHRRWDHLGELVIDRTIKKKRRVLPTPDTTPELALANMS